MNEKGIIVGVVVCLLAIAAILFVTSGGWRGTQEVSGDPYAPQLAQCLKDNGATFFGAFWCPHCKKQKELFGAAEKALPYVECSTSDGNGQTPICKDKKIESYPTWEFKDGSRLMGEQTFAVLAAKSDCPVQGVSGANTKSPLVATTSTPLSAGAQ